MKIIISLFLFLFWSKGYTQYNSQRELLLKNHVKEEYVFIPSKAGKKVLAGNANYTPTGNLSKHTSYENKKVTLTILYEYDAQNQVIQITSIRQTDTLIVSYNPNVPDSAYMEVILGGIPDYFPKTKYLKNGLMKYTHFLISGGRQRKCMYRYVYY